MMIIRPVRPGDLDDLVRLAEKAEAGMTTLPPDRRLLEKKIEASLRAFSKDTSRPGDDHYLFVLEDRRRGSAVGTAGIVSSVGLSEAFYSYRIGTVVHASRELGVYNKMSTLYLSNDYTGCTEIGSLFLDPDFRKGKNGKLLSKCRFVFLGEFPDRFARKVIAEMRGFSDELGPAPFWEALGRRFFSMDFSQADFLSVTGNRSFIAELMPKHPVYLNLLDEQAQGVIGKVHEKTKPALKMLEKEGFTYEGYIDIFDGGPTVETELKEIRAVKESVTVPVSIRTPPSEGDYYLVSNRRLQGFRCGLVQLPGAVDERLEIDAVLAQELEVADEDTVRIVSLD